MEIRGSWGPVEDHLLGITFLIISLSLNAYFHFPLVFEKINKKLTDDPLLWLLR